MLREGLGQKELQRLVNLWLKRLRLQDWQVKAECCTVADLPDALGQIPYDTEEKIATLKVRDDAPVESTVVHELLHLRLEPFSDGDEAEPRHAEREIAINLMACCYIAAYPRKRGKR